MNRENFPEELKRLREEKTLSQEDLATLLANSHRVFGGINQVTLSKWERNETTTSLIRRLGIANYFSQHYEFDDKEAETISPSVKLSDIPVNQDIAYRYTIDTVESYTMKTVPNDVLEDILSIHSKLYSLDFLSFYQADHLSVDNIVILSFYCKGLMMGHIVYDDKNDMLLSVGSISLSVRKQVLRYLTESMAKKSLTIPAHDPAMAQFLYDLYLKPTKAMFGLFLFKVDSLVLINNPFYQNLTEESSPVFKYLRYYSLRKKRKSIEFTL
ncbi:helix-turn-helix domain-containing protein [Vibrio tasmaniensis]|uniref:helix-turn-helix domain-containing protein n=1 Tax=Vibrio tasmaniensis TaxID=212663 RepID=UPI00111AC579|nr:helix-turn-helix transcriptional regulator [Vibrio tasmaniensis]